MQIGVFRNPISCVSKFILKFREILSLMAKNGQNFVCSCKQQVFEDEEKVEVNKKHLLSSQ